MLKNSSEFPECKGANVGSDCFDENGNGFLNTVLHCRLPFEYKSTESNSVNPIDDVVAASDIRSERSKRRGFNEKLYAPQLWKRLQYCQTLVPDPPDPRMQVKPYCADQSPRASTFVIQRQTGTWFNFDRSLFPESKPDNRKAIQE